MSSSVESANGEGGRLAGRVLTVFSNPEEEFVTEYALETFDLERFRDWFNAGETDPSMNDCYVVLPKDVEFLSAYLPDGVAFDFGRYCYFVETGAEV